MRKHITVTVAVRDDLLLSEDPLGEMVQDAARGVLRLAVEAEFSDYLGTEDRRDSQGRRQVVRGGHHPEREIVTGIGKVPVRVPKARSLDGGPALFHSALVPPYVRRSPTVDRAVPALYLAGISQRDISKALGAVLGEDRVSGVSASTISRLKRRWEEEYEQWRKRRLDDEDWVYLWADGIHCQTRGPDGERLCLLVVIGVTRAGKKQFLAIEEGPRESSGAWADVLRDLRERGMCAPRLAVADGALGFWKALAEVFPDTRAQRCWVHKVRNVLSGCRTWCVSDQPTAEFGRNWPDSGQNHGKIAHFCGIAADFRSNFAGCSPKSPKSDSLLCYLPKRIHDRARAELREIWLAESEADARAAARAFIRKYGDKYPKATDCLERDLGELLTFYGYPEGHWQSLRTTNPIESAFATIRHRTRQTRNCASRKTVLAMVFKLACAAEAWWRPLAKQEELAKVFEFVPYKDGKAIGHQDDAGVAA